MKLHYMFTTCLLALSLSITAQASSTILDVNNDSGEKIVTHYRADSLPYSVTKHFTENEHWKVSPKYIRTGEEIYTYLEASGENTYCNIVFKPIEGRHNIIHVKTGSDHCSFELE